MIEVLERINKKTQPIWPCASASTPDQSLPGSLARSS
jgi:hypothetical protein